jgi:hypothetical protein
MGDTVESSTSASTKTEGGGLGLVYNVGRIHFKKSVVNSLVGVALPATQNSSDFIDIMKRIKTELRKIEVMDVLKDDPYKSECKPILSAIIVDLNSIQKAIMDMGRFKDTTDIEDRPYNCYLSFNEITPQDLKNIETKIKNYVSDIKQDQTVAQMSTNPEHYKTLVDNLLLMDTFVHTELAYFVDRVELMENLANGEVSSRLPFLLESVNCLQPGELQHMTINFCDKTQLGFFCKLTLNVHKIVEEYQRYIPISYHGVQFRAENTDQILLKSSSGHWETLQCEDNTKLMESYATDEDVEDLTGCEILPYQNPCTKVLETKEYEKILKHCNFTKKGEIEHTVGAVALARCR